MPTAPVGLHVRDHDDQAILATAVASNVDVLVTGDRDLLVLGHCGRMPIVDPRGFWDMLRRLARKPE